MYSPKAYIEEFIVSRLEEYIDDFNRESLDIGLWTGEIALKNFKLKQNIWSLGSDLNLTLEHGHIDNLHIEIPWSKIHTGQIKAYVKNVYLVFKLNVNEETEKEIGLKEAAYSKKMKAVEREEIESLHGNKLEPEKWGSKYYHNLIQSLLSRITSGFEFHGTNFRISLILPSLNINETIHVRLLVSTIRMTQAQPDQFSRSASDSNEQARKVIDIQDLAISVSCINKPYNTLVQSESDIFNLISEPLKDIFLNPCHISVQLYGPKEELLLKNSRRIVSVQLSNTEITPSYQQLFLLCNCNQKLQIDARKSMLHHIRSVFIQEKVSNKSSEHKKTAKKRVINYKQYWAFSIEAVKYLNRHKNQTEGIGGIIESCKKRVQYKLLYRKHITRMLQPEVSENILDIKSTAHDRAEPEFELLEKSLSKKDILIIRKSILRSISKKGISLQSLRKVLAPYEKLEATQNSSRARSESFDEIDAEISKLLDDESIKDVREATSIEWDVDVLISRLAISIFDASFSTKLSNTFQLLPAPRLSIAVYSCRSHSKISADSKSIAFKVGTLKVFGIGSLELLSCGKEPDYWLGEETLQEADNSDYCFDFTCNATKVQAKQDEIVESNVVNKVKTVDLKMRLSEVAVHWDEHSLQFARDLCDGLLAPKFLAYNDPFLNSKRLAKVLKVNQLMSESQAMNTDITFKGFKLEIPYKSSVETIGNDHSYKIVKNTVTSSQNICVKIGVTTVQSGRPLFAAVPALSSKPVDKSKNKEPKNMKHGDNRESDMYDVYIEGKSPQGQKSQNFEQNAPKWEKIDEMAHNEVKSSLSPSFNTFIIHVEDSDITFTRYLSETGSLQEGVIQKPLYFCGVFNLPNVPLRNTSTKMKVDFYLSPLMLGLSVNSIMALLDAGNSIASVVGADMKRKNTKVSNCLPPRLEALSGFCQLQMTCHAEDVKVEFLSEAKNSRIDNIISSLRQFVRLKMHRGENSRVFDIYKHILLLKLRNLSDLSLVRLDELVIELVKALNTRGCHQESELLSISRKICQNGHLTEYSIITEPILSFELKGFELFGCVLAYDRIFNFSLKELLVSDRYGEPIFEIASKLKELENVEEVSNFKGTQKKNRKSLDKSGHSAAFYRKLADGFKDNRLMSLPNDCALSLSFMHQDCQYDWGQGGHAEDIESRYYALYKYEILNRKIDGNDNNDPYYQLYKHGLRDLEGQVKLIMHELYCFIPSSAIPYIVGQITTLNKHIQTYLLTSSIVNGRKAHYDWKDILQGPIKSPAPLPHKKPLQQHLVKNATAASKRKPYLTSLVAKLTSAAITIDYNDYPLSHCRFSNLSLDMQADKKLWGAHSTSLFIRNVDLYDLTEVGRFHSQVIFNRDQEKNLVECKVLSKPDEVVVNVLVSGLNICYINRFKLELEEFLKTMREKIIAASRSEVIIEEVPLIESDCESLDEDADETEKASALDSDDSSDSSDSSSSESGDEIIDVRILSLAHKKSSVTHKKSGAYMPIFRHNRPLKAVMTPSKLQSKKRQEPIHNAQELNVSKAVQTMLQMSFEDLTLIIPRNSNSMELVSLVVESGSLKSYSCSESWFSPVTSKGGPGSPTEVYSRDDGGKNTLHFDCSSNEWRATKKDSSSSGNCPSPFWEIPHTRKEGVREAHSSMNDSVENHAHSEFMMNGHTKDSHAAAGVKRNVLVLNNASLFVSLVNKFSDNEYKSVSCDEEKYFAGVFENESVYFGNKNNSQSWAATSKTPFHMNVVVDHKDCACRVLLADTEDFSALDLTLSMAELYLLESVWFDNFFEMPPTLGAENDIFPPYIEMNEKREVPNYDSPLYFEHFSGRDTHFELLFVRACFHLNTSIKCNYFQEDPLSLKFLQTFSDIGTSRKGLSADLEGGDELNIDSQTLPICLLSIDGLIFHSRSDAGETNRIAAAASFIEIKDTREPISTAYPIILSASCASSIESDDGIIRYFDPDFDYGLHMKPESVMKSANIPIQFSYLKSQLSNWSTSNIGLDNLDLRIENADMLWILIDYFSCYNKSPAYGNPAASVYQTLPSEKKPYSGTDVRLFVTRPHISIMQNPMNVKSSSLFLETEKGVFYRFVCDSESSTKMELNVFDVALVIMKTFRPPPEARGMRGSAGSGRGVRTIVEFLSLAYSLENHSRDSTVDSLLHIFYADRNTSTVEDKDNFVQLEHSHYKYQMKDSNSEEHTEFVADIARPKCIFPLTNVDTKFDTSYNVVTSYEDVMFIVAAVKEFLKIKADPTSSNDGEESKKPVNEDEIADSGGRLSSKDQLSALVKKFTVLKIANMKLVIVDNILGLHLPLAQVFVDNVDLNLTQRMHHNLVGDKASSEVGAYAHILLRSDYFNNLKKCWEPFMETFDARCFYEENPLRGKGLTLRVLSDAHFTVSGALLRTLDDAINMVKSHNLNTDNESLQSFAFEPGSQINLNLSDSSSRELKSINSTQALRRITKKEASDASRQEHAEHVLTAPLSDAVRVGFSILNLTGQPLRYFQQWEGSQNTVEYVDDNTRGLLNCVASTKKIRNNDIIEEAFNIQTEGEVITRKYQVVGHKVAVQLSGYEWISSVQADEPGVKFQVLAPIQGRIGLEDLVQGCKEYDNISKRKIRNALQLVAEVVPHNGGRLLKLRSVFTIKNNTSHAIKLLSVDRKENFNKMSDEPFILNGADSFSLPIALLHKSVINSNGSSIGCLFIRPDNNVIERESGRKVSHMQSVNIDYSREPISLLDIVRKNFESSSDDLLFGRDTDQSVEKHVSVMMQLFCDIGTRKHSPANANDDLTDNVNRKNHAIQSSKLPYFCYNVEIQRHGGSLENDSKIKKGPEAYLPNLGMYKEKFRGKSSTDFSPVHYTIVVHPPIILENLLPSGGIFELMHATQKVILWSAYIEAGEAKPIHTVTLDAPLMLLLNLRYCKTLDGTLVHKPRNNDTSSGIAGKIQKTIEGLLDESDDSHQNDDEHLILTDTAGQKIRLNIENSEGGGGQRHISIFCPYWIVNTTQYALQIQEDGSNSLPAGTYNVGLNKDGTRSVDGLIDNLKTKTNESQQGTIFPGKPGPLKNYTDDELGLLKNLSFEQTADLAYMFNYDNAANLLKMVRRVTVKLDNSDWCYPFSLDSIGVNQSVTIDDGSKGVLELGFHIQLAPGRLSKFTKIVRFMPKFVVVNNMQSNVKILQPTVFGQSKVELDLNAGCWKPYHLPDSEGFRALIARMEAPWGQCIPFTIDAMGKYTLSVKKVSDLTTITHVDTRGSQDFTVEINGSEEKITEVGLWFETDWNEANVVVKNLRKGSFAAEKLNVQVGDVLQMIDEDEITGKMFEQAMSLIKDKVRSGKPFTLKFLTIEEKIRLSLIANNKMTTLKSINSSSMYSRMNDVGKSEIPIHLELKTVEASTFITISTVDENIKAEYRLENKTVSHYIYYKQKGVIGNMWCELGPGESINYICEDPFVPRKLFLKAGRNVLYPDSDVSPDKYFKLRIQSLGSDLIKDNIGFLTGGTIDSNVTVISLDAIGQRDLILLRDTDCKLRTIVEAEGPTKILRIYPDANIGDLEKKEAEKLFESESFKKDLLTRELNFSINFMKEQIVLLKEWKGLVELLIQTKRKGDKEVKTNEKQVPELLSQHNTRSLENLKRKNDQLLALAKKDIDNHSSKLSFGNKLSASLPTEKIEHLVGHTLKDVGQLYIEVLEAKELRPFVTGKKENIFVKLYIKSENMRYNVRKFDLFGSNRYKYTYVCGQTLDPVWLGQKFIIETPEVTQPKAFKLRVVVQSHGIVRSQRFLGRADIQFSYLHHQQEVEGWFPLRARESIRASALNADTGNMTGSVGSIKLRVQWVHNSEGLANHYSKKIDQRLEQLRHFLNLQKNSNKELINTISRNVGPLPNDNFEMKNVMKISSVIPSPATIIQSFTKPAFAFTGYAIEQTKNVIGMKKSISENEPLINAFDEPGSDVTNNLSHDDVYDDYFSPIRDNVSSRQVSAVLYPDSQKAVSFCDEDVAIDDVPSTARAMKTKHTININHWIRLNEELKKLDVDKFMRRYQKIVDADTYFHKRLEEECNRSYNNIYTRSGTLEIIPVTAEDLPWDKFSPDRPLHIKIEYGEKVQRSSSAIRAANLTWYYEDTNTITSEDGLKQGRSKDKSSIMEFDINTSLIESAIRVRVIEEFYTHNKELARVELPVLNLLDCICTLEEGSYYDRWFPLTLTVNSIHAEGEKQNFAQTVLTEQEQEKTFSDAHKPCIRLKIRWRGAEKVENSAPENSYNYLRIQLPSLSISIVDSATLTKMARDVLHISFTGSDIRHSRSYENTIWMVNTNWFQIDNQISDSAAPVLLAPAVLQKSKPVFMMQSLKNNLLSTDKLNSYDYIALQIQELDVKIEQQTVVTLWDIWQTWVRDHRQALSEYLENNTGAKNLLHSSSELLGFATCKGDTLSSQMSTVAMFQPDEGNDDYQNKLYIRTCVLKELKINISFIIGTKALMLSSAKSLNTERFTIGKNSGLAYTLFAFLRQIGEVVIDLSSSISDAPIRISQYSEHHIFLTEHEFSKRLQSHYFQYLMQQVYKIVGSLDLVGNPVNLLSTLGTGVKDFFFEPALAMIDNPTEINKLNKLGKGFLKGAISLVSNTSTGFIGAGTTVTRAVGRNFAKLSMDKAFIRNREELQRAPKTLREAFIRPFRDIGNGIYCGFVGLVKAPYNTFRYNKPSTLFTGIMIGVTGLATKPSVGVLDAVTHTGDAFQLAVRTMKHDYADPVTRGRLSYVFGLDGRILEYDYATALGHKIIDVLNIVKDDQGLRYSIQDGSRLFMKVGHLCMCVSSESTAAIPLKISGDWNQRKSSMSLVQRSESNNRLKKYRNAFYATDMDQDNATNDKDPEFVIYVTIIPRDTPGLDQVVILTTTRVVVVDYQRKKGGTTIKLLFEIALHHLKVVAPVDKMLGTKCTLRLLFDATNGQRPSKPGLVGQKKEFFEKGLLQGDYELVADKTHEDALNILRNNINIVARAHFVDEDVDDEHGYIHKIGVWEFTSTNNNAVNNYNSGFENKAVRSALETSKWHFGDSFSSSEAKQLPKWLQEAIAEAIEAHSDIKEVNNILLTERFDNPDFQDLFEHFKNKTMTFNEYKEGLVELEKITGFNENLRIETQRKSILIDGVINDIDGDSPSTAIGKIMNYTKSGLAAAASVIGKNSPIQISRKQSKDDSEVTMSRTNVKQDFSQSTPVVERDGYQLSPMPLMSDSFRNSFNDVSQLSNAESINLILSRMDRLESLLMQVAENNINNHNNNNDKKS